MNVNEIKIKMDNSLWKSFDIHLSDLTIFEFGDSLKNVMIFVENCNEDLYYYFPENDTWKVNEGWTYFTKDDCVNEVYMASSFKQAFNKSYNDLRYIGNWSPYKKYSNCNYYHFNDVNDIEYLYDRLLGTWSISEDSNKCCCRTM